MKKRLLRYAAYALGFFVVLGVVGYFAFQRLTSPPAAVNPVLAGGGPSVALMDFSQPFSLSPPAAGWWHLNFITKPEMKLSFVEKEGMKALRCETSASGSIFGRHTDIDLGTFPTLTWSWLIETPVVSAIAETESKGDDHPARFMVQFTDAEKSVHYMEIIWSNGAFKPGQWKYIGSFAHYVANGGDARTGENTKRWFAEKVNLMDLYRTATKRTDTPRLTNLAIFCDTDDTGGKSVAYFGKAELSR
jgi:Protein of unknown function (DUF3047)